MKEAKVFKLIDFSKIDNILNGFLEPFECTARLSTDFAYFNAENLITYSVAVASRCEDSFMTFVKDLFPEIDADIFLWSILHELGHHETEDDFDEDEWEDYMIKSTTVKTDMEYYNLPIERAATEWAGEFMLEHTDEITALWKELQAAIVEIYIELKIS